jgi:hypothetical protein
LLGVHERAEVIEGGSTVRKNNRPLRDHFLSYSINIFLTE